jgi:folate-binding protein YgfZ
MKAALLPDRGVVKVAGADAATFLDGLITADLDKVKAGAARYAALLTPQGKIIADFIVVKAVENDHYFLDCPRALAPTLAQRLNFYKLRAKVIVEDLSETLGVLAVWDGTAASGPGLSYADPRLPALGLRCMISTHDAFPHEADMDQLSGVDFDKGCFVGQEVVSRMEHRGTARTRVVPVAFDGPPPEAGVTVTAGDTTLGMMGSGTSAIGRGLATLRLDRVADAMAKGTPIVAGGIAIRPVKPAWARFRWPGEAKAAE